MEEDEEGGERGGRHRVTSEEAKATWRETLQLHFHLRDDNDEEDEGEDEEEEGEDEEDPGEEEGASEVETSDGESQLSCVVVLWYCVCDVMLYAPCW